MFAHAISHLMCLSSYRSWKSANQKARNWSVIVKIIFLLSLALALYFSCFMGIRVSICQSIIIFWPCQSGSAIVKWENGRDCVLRDQSFIEDYVLLWPYRAWLTNGSACDKAAIQITCYHLCGWIDVSRGASRNWLIHRLLESRSSGKKYKVFSFWSAENDTYVCLENIID